ncbi:Peroxisome biogenesis factor 10 [Pleurostoma richardsiae]|uniref:RING-type E3 ubiquitin transferase n=1 Tax=Pleurostoma richardsiae TaxID=41990 RepID=A0AA38VXR6_9PEZI|nr:Peroxisome biogenesis factor 10 [Pleurostoma richardsiae]
MASPSYSSSSAPSITSSPYPFAAAPDIIRAHQKDAYFQGVLTNQLTDLHRRLLGARSSHAWASEARTAADLLYLSLTTLVGNRTLGEEYCDLVQVESPPTPSSSSSTNNNSSSTGGPVLPSLPRRAAYIASSVLLPYALARLLPSVRSRARARLEARLTALTRENKSHTREYRAARYVLAHLPSLTSGDHVRAVALAAFYFTGAYYSLAKRAAGLRYVFTRRVDEGPGGGGGGGGGRAGYEVLGVLLVVQLAVQGWLHLRTALGPAPAGEEAAVEAAIRERARADVVDVSLDANSYSSNNELLLGASGGGGGAGQHGRSRAALGAMAHTPVPKGERPRYDLGAGEDVMAWVRGAAQRKCTLCLEGLRDPAATPCGHVFCWSCIGDWVREKPECPLCRREAMVQHILPLRVV